MNKILVYKLACVTEAAEKECLKWDTESAPTKCPDDSSHVIIAESVRIVDVIDQEIKPVRQVLGKDEYSISPRALFFTAPVGISVHYKQLDKALAVKGGIAFSQNCNIGDEMKIYIEDKDNILGFGEDFILADYVPEWFIMPGVPNELTDVSIGELPAPGLYLKCVYDNKGASPVNVILNMISFEKDE